MSNNLGLNIYLLFIVSWFLHFGARLPFLGAIRFDLLLVCILSTLALSKIKDSSSPTTQTDKLLKILIAYSIVTIPFVEWPGSVIKSGIPNFIKAIVFYYFTTIFIKTESDLTKIVRVFLACQIFRILEPLYLHVTVGYWGNTASMANWEYLNRLSGAPSDIVNANGLAFIICTVLPFLYFLGGASWKYRIASIPLILASIYALVLTGSRSGIIGVAVIALGVLIKLKHRFFAGMVLVFTAVIGFSVLSPDTQDRYLSIFGKGEKNAATSSERWEGMEQQIRVALRRPIFGHGLGTSAEANAHFVMEGPYAGMEMPAHNLYVEIAEELGLPGVIIFVLLIKSIIENFIKSQRLIWQRQTTTFLKLITAMQVWLAMNIIFSFASYGLSSYEWYLFAGFSVVLRRLNSTGLVCEKVGWRNGQESRKANVKWQY